MKGKQGLRAKLKRALLRAKRGTDVSVEVGINLGPVLNAKLRVRKSLGRK